MSFEGSLANRLLRETNALSVPVDLSLITQTKDIIVKEDDCDGYAGMILVVNKTVLISVRSSIKEGTKKRFTIAHELGHYILPGHISVANNAFRCTDADVNSFGKFKNKEIEANIFAAELLMPEQLFKPKVQYDDISKKLIIDLTEEFQTSLTSTCIRLVNLKPEYSLICSENSTIKWFYRGDEFPLFLNASPRTPLHRDSFAYNFFKTGKSNNDFFNVPAVAWISGHHMVKESSSIMEMSIGIPSYKQALSFLYVDTLGSNGYEDEDDYYGELDGQLRFKK